MKIYTYYQDISFPVQQELVDLWKISWSRHGYEPIVLNLEDAKKHSYFEIFDTEMRRIFKEITDKQINNYGMSCWFRWLAYATQNEEKFYVSDYDAINLNFPITEPSDKLHLMDADCPFLASGTPKQFENLCKLFVDISNQRIEILKELTDHYHDQEFFHYNFMPQQNTAAEELRLKHHILMTRNRREIGGSIDPVENKILAGPVIGYTENEKYKVVHVSHQNCEIMRSKYIDLKENYSESELRIFMIKNLLNLK